MAHPLSNSLPDSADHWLAYRYLAGELRDDEAAACEARLESDLSLQVALAETVELTNGLSRLSRHPAVRSSSAVATAAGRNEPHRTRGRTTAWAAAAVTLLAVGLLFTTALVAPRQIARQGETTAQLLDASSVVAMWSELGDDDSDLRSDRSVGAAKVEPFSDEDLEIPDWMLVAVLDESVEDEDAEPPQEHQL